MRKFNITYETYTGGQRTVSKEGMNIHDAVRKLINCKRVIEWESDEVEITPEPAKPSKLWETFFAKQLETSYA